MSGIMTVSCGNVFEDLGFPPDEAAAMLAREKLLIALEKELRKRGKKQLELSFVQQDCFRAVPEAHS